ncbi:MAG: tetratricopeptide repeat protein [Desulfobulbus sp.]|nr:tetratricopeptide repeat protein [Desulfobulbus sp.]
MEPRLITLESCHKKYTYDQDKACSPAETVSRFLERLRITKLDVLKEVRRVDTGRLDIPVYFSVCGDDAQKVIGNKKQMGKGSTPEQAQASACMELAERFSLFSFLKSTEHFLVGDYTTLKSMGYPIVSLESLLKSVHDTSLAPELLETLLSGLPLRWVWSLRLTDNTPMLLPFSWFYAINEFNGSSAGNTNEEAIVQGISEVVERHVCALIARNRLVTPAIDPGSVTDPVARGLLAKFQQNGIEVFLNDFSLNTGIPTVGALAYDPDTFPHLSEIVFTAGTAPDAHKAMIRALTEVAQLAGDFNSGSNYEASGLPKPSELGDVSHVIETPDTVSMGVMADLEHEDILEEIKNCVNALSDIDLEVFVVDVTHPQLQIPAVYTVVPGAHFRERAKEGRAALFAAKLAAELLTEDALEEKLAHMQKILPDAYYLQFYRGRNLYEQGDVEAACSCFQQALDQHPAGEDVPYIFSYLGLCLRDQGKFTEAIGVLQEGLAYDEERPDIHNTLGVCYFKTSRYTEAVASFRRAVALNPMSAIDYANLALNLEKIGEYREAITQYETALSLDSSITFAAENLAELLRSVAIDKEQA